MKFTIPSKIAAFVFAAVYAIFGIMHFISGSQMAAYVPIPGGLFWVYFTGFAMIAYAIAIFINNKYQKEAGYLLALLLLFFIGFIHIPHMMNGDHMAMISMLKDLAMAAAAIFIANNSEEY